MEATTVPQAQDQMTQAAYSSPLNQTNSDDVQNTPATPQGQAQDSSQGQNQMQAPNQVSQLGSQPSGQPSGQKPDLSKSGMNGQSTTPAPSPAQVANHPAVQKASLLHTIAQTLAGGPRYKDTINPNTGTMTRTPVPMSRADIGMAIAMEAIGGALSGLAQKGPGAEGRAALAGFQQAQQERQQQDQQQEQEASQNYARAAQITQANFQTHQNALRLGMMEHDAHEQYVKDAAPALENLNKVNAIQAQHVHESDLLSKYHVTKDMAVVDGVVPRMDPNTHEQAKNPDGSLAWDNTYSVIDPEAKIEIPSDTLKMLADHHIPGYYKIVDGKTVPVNLPADTQVRAKFVVDGLATASAIKITEQQVNNQLRGLATGDQDAKQFDVNLTQALQDGRVSTKDLQVASRYTSLPLNQWRAAMEKDKVNPDTIGNVTSLIPQEAYDQMQKAQDKAKTDQKVQEKVDEQKALLPGQIREAAEKAKVETAAAGARAYNAEVGRQRAKSAYDSSSTAIKDMLKNPKIDAIPSISETPVNGVNQKYMAALQTADPNIAALVKAIGEGRQLQSKYGLAKEDGQRLGALVNRAYPEYSQVKAEAYEKMLNSYTSGKDADQIERGNTTYRHIQEYLENSRKLAANVPGSTIRVAGGKDASQLVEEVNGAYTKGVLHEEQRKNIIEGLNSVIPQYRETAAQELATLLSAKTSEKLGTFRRGKVTSATPDFEIVSPDAKEAYRYIMGSKADPNFGTSKTQNPGGQPQFTPPPGSFRKMVNGSWQYKLPNNSIVDANGRPIQQ